MLIAGPAAEPAPGRGRPAIDRSPASDWPEFEAFTAVDSCIVVLARGWRRPGTDRGTGPGGMQRACPSLPETPRRPPPRGRRPSGTAAGGSLNRASLAPGREDEPQVGARPAAGDLIRHLQRIAVGDDA